MSTLLVLAVVIICGLGIWAVIRKGKKVVTINDAPYKIEKSEPIVTPVTMVEEPKTIVETPPSEPVVEITSKPAVMQVSKKPKTKKPKTTTETTAKPKKNNKKPKMTVVK